MSPMTPAYRITSYKYKFVCVFRLSPHERHNSLCLFALCTGHTPCENYPTTLYTEHNRYDNVGDVLCTPYMDNYHKTYVST